jgi:HD-GYP domain-containing protein (c-di-GMP phosphodiesterase class II)
LKGEGIPLFARIFSVVDVWDALMSDRPYRPAWSLNDVKEYIRERSGTEFDPQIVEIFFRYLEDENCEDIWHIRKQPG